MPSLRRRLFVIALAAAWYGMTSPAVAANPPPAAPPANAPGQSTISNPASLVQPPATAATAPALPPNPGASAGPPLTTAAAVIRPSKIVGPFSVDAEHVTFYSNRYVVSADENVRLKMSDGTRITGDTFSMDLRLNRFVIAGNVTLYTPDGKVQNGAAFSEFFDFDRSYFLPVGDEPDRWTFTQADFTHPLLGREMPGDTFFLPDLSTERVFLRAFRAYIVPRESVRFTPAKINFGLAFVQFPEYFLNFSINPNFAQNSLPGAYIDGPLDFEGGSHSLATLHLRYDPANKLFPALELHQVSERHYVVASINPITRPLKQYDLLAFDRLSPKVQAQLQLQEIAFQQNFQTPLSATAYGNLRVTAGLRQSFLQFTNDSYYDSLLGRPAPHPAPGIGEALFHGDPSHPWVPDHPTDEELTWTGFQHDLVPRKLTFQLRSGFGTAHSGISPLSEIGGVRYTTVWNHFFGLTLVVPSLPVLTDTHGQKVFFNATYDREYQYFSLPHKTDTQSEVVSFSKVYNWKFDTFVSYSLTNVRDLWGAQQLQEYAPYTAPITGANGVKYDAYRAFRGLSTQRALQEQFVYDPAGPLNFVLSFQQRRDFPGPIAEPFGNNVQYGTPPYSATFDVRYRYNRIITLDLARSYFFNFGGYERWSPQFAIQVTK